MADESPQERIDALVRTAAAMQREIEILEAELEYQVRRCGKMLNASPAMIASDLAESHARIDAKLANPDEGLSGRIH